MDKIDDLQKALADRTPLPVEINIQEGIVLVGALQEAVRNPETGPAKRKAITRIAMKFQDAIVDRCPEVEFTLDMGWDDVPVEDQPS